MTPSVCPKIPFPPFPHFWPSLSGYQNTDVQLLQGPGNPHWSGKSLQSPSRPNRSIDSIALSQGPTSGAGICRILAHPSHGNLAVAVLARNPENLNAVAKGLRSSTPNPVEAFPTDTSPEKLSKAFSDIRSHSCFKDLKLKVAVFHVKHASKVTWLRPIYVLASPECNNRNPFLRKRIPSSRNPLTLMLEVRWPFRKR